MSRHAHKWRLFDHTSMVGVSLFTIDTRYQFTCGCRMYTRAHGRCRAPHQIIKVLLRRRGALSSKVDIELLIKQ
eukprot:7927000-Karenia_brevis.AAC.1